MLTVRARRRNLEPDAERKDGLAACDGGEGAQGPRGTQDDQAGQVGQGALPSLCRKPRSILRATADRLRSLTFPPPQAPTRKIYMLAGIQPSVELTGGPWFTDNELDTELVEQLKKIVQKFLQQKVRYRFRSRQLSSLPADARLT